MNHPFQIFDPSLKKKKKKKKAPFEIDSALTTAEDGDGEDNNKKQVSFNDTGDDTEKKDGEEKGTSKDGELSKADKFVCLYLYLT